MESEILWKKNEEEHQAIKQDLQDIKAQVSAVPLILIPILKWCVFPLILVLGGIIGADKILGNFPLP